WLSRPDFNGCAFVRAVAELQNDPQVSHRAKKRKEFLLKTIEDACQEAGAANPSKLARQLALIIEGATTTAFVSGRPHPVISTAVEISHLALVEAGLSDYEP